MPCHPERSRAISEANRLAKSKDPVLAHGGRSAQRHTDWAQRTPTEHAGDTGVALWRTRDFGDIRVRMVEYSPGYAANHWCNKGHVLLCLEGSLDIRLKDGAQMSLKPGQSYHVGDNDPGHRSSTETGARLFIVD